MPHESPPPGGAGGAAGVLRDGGGEHPRRHRLPALPRQRRVLSPAGRRPAGRGPRGPPEPVRAEAHLPPPSRRHAAATPPAERPVIYGLGAAGALGGFVVGRLMKKGRVSGAPRGGVRARSERRRGRAGGLRGLGHTGPTAARPGVGWVHGAREFRGGRRARRRGLRWATHILKAAEIFIALPYMRLGKQRDRLHPSRWSGTLVPRHGVPGEVASVLKRSAGQEVLETREAEISRETSDSHDQREPQQLQSFVCLRIL